MHPLIKSILTLTVLYLLAACTTMTTHMTPVLDSDKAIKPEPDKALVIFIRSSSYGGVIQATIYDDQEYIGTVSANTQVAFQATPGDHMFMVIGESADFMRAELKAGLTYYARVAARMGWWKARFSFIPYNGEESEKELQSWLSDTERVELNNEGIGWAASHDASIQEKRNAYLPDWHSKAEEDKQTLLMSSGR